MAFLLLTVASFAHQAKEGRACLLTPQIGVVSDCIYETPTGQFFIAPQYLEELDFGSAGLASVRSEAPPYGWMYVNQKGSVVVTGVPTFDNLADEFSDGLVRTVVANKYGYANRKGSSHQARIRLGVTL